MMATSKFVMHILYLFVIIAHTIDPLPRKQMNCRVTHKYIIYYTFELLQVLPIVDERLLTSPPYMD